MLRIRTLPLLLLVPLVLSVLHAEDDSEGPLQFWPSFIVEYHLTDSVELYASEQGKWEDNAHDLFLYRFAAGAEFKVSEHVELAAHFRQVESKHDGKWTTSRAPHADCTLRWKSEAWQVKLRNRIEYWYVPDRVDYVRGRQQIKLSSERAIPHTALKPYLAEEVFYTFDNRGLNANRIYAGATVSAGAHWQVDAYYCLLSQERGSSWSNFHVLGSNIKLSF